MMATGWIKRGWAWIAGVSGQDHGVTRRAAVPPLVLSRPVSARRAGRFRRAAASGLAVVSLITAPFTPSPARADSVLYATSATLTATPSQSTFGQSIELKATIDTLGKPAASGDVTFRDGTTNLGVQALAAAGIGVAQVVAGGDHTCALSNSGRVWCWGNGGSGRLGNGTATDFNSTPVLVPTLTGATALSAGNEHTCALVANGAVKCWGRGFEGQLGTGTTNTSYSPVDVSGVSGATALAAGAFHTCAVVANGEVKCWGSNGSGQLGDGTTNSSTTPVDVSGLSGATSLVAGADHTCAVVANGAVKCWGWNYYGQLGDGTGNTRVTPVDVSGLSGATFLAAGGEHTCALVANGAVKCWGRGNYGQLGDGSTNTRVTPVDVSGLSGATSLAAGDNHTCSVVANGAVKCWGNNGYGQLGDGTGNTRYTPVDVSGLSGATSLVAGGSHTCAVVANGAVKCWGYGGFGQLGDGTGNTRVTPVDVSGLSGATSLAAGDRHTCAVVANGAVKCWGNNEYGQLGDGTGNNRVTPVDVSGLSGATSLVAGGSHTCAVVANGAVKCWGSNGNGQLGDGTGYNSYTPVDVSGLSGATSLAAGGEHTCALVAGGSVACFGDNREGQIGIPAPLPSSTPLEIPNYTLLNRAVATLSNVSLPGTGTRALTATLAATETHEGAVGSLDHEVTETPTTTTLQSSLNPSPFGASVTFTATVTGDGGTPTGTVTFLDGEDELGSSSLSGGIATLDVSTLPVGSASITARYEGNGPYLTSTSDAVNQVVEKVPTTTSVSVAASSTYGEPVSVTATVSAEGPTPTGTVAFLVDGAPYGAPATLDGTGKATIDVTGLGAGTRTFAAVYSGSSEHVESETELASDHTVNKASTTVSLDQPTTPWRAGRSVELVATVSSTVGTPEGTVRFLANTVEVGSAEISEGAARATVVLPLGEVDVTAAYGGGANHAAATSQARSVTVERNPTVARLMTTPSSSTFGQSVRMIGEVDGLGGGAPSGSVVIDSDQEDRWTLTLTPFGAGQSTLAVGKTHACALNAEGGVACWGGNSQGQLGQGDTQPLLTPTLAFGLASGIKAVISGDEHSCALTQAGAVKCWGSNANGQLGIPGSSNAGVPSDVTELTDPVRALAAGAAHTCAVTEAGALLCWGQNGAGQLGLGDTTDKDAPTPVPGLASGVVAASAGATHTCALKDDDTVACFGTVGSVSFGASPVTVADIAAGALVSGRDHLCMVTTSGGLACMGANTAGQLGTGGTTALTTPTIVTGLDSGVAAAAAGSDHTCALSTTGALSCFGGNARGQLGLGDQDTRLTPVALTMPSPVAALGAGDGQTCAVLTTGATLCFGANDTGQLGLGDVVDRAAPIMIPEDTHRALARSSVEITVSGLPAGTRAFDITFKQTLMHAGATASVQHVVGDAPTTTTLQSSLNPSPFGASVTFTATVTGGSEAPTVAVTAEGGTSVGPVNVGGSTPTGTVTFLDGEAELGSSSLSGGIATLQVSTLSVGTASITARYEGNSPYLTSTSDAVSQVINKATTTLTVNDGGAMVGSPMTVTATVISANTTPGGSVTFETANGILGTAELDEEGVAQLDNVSLPAGSYSVTARFAETATHLASSNTGTYVVDKFDTNTGLSTSAPTRVFGQEVTLTATVAIYWPASTPRSVPTPDGTVTFLDGATNLGTATLSGGVATLRVTTVPVGTRSITARYNGTATYDTSTSPAAPLTVAKARTTLALTAPTSVPFGQAATLVAEPSPIAPGGGVPSGTIAFRRGATQIGTAPLVNGRATLQATLPFGDQAITAAYQGSASHIASTSATSAVQVSYAVGDEFVVNTTRRDNQGFPKVATLPVGGVVAWRESDATASDGYGIVARRIAADGKPFGTEIRVAARERGLWLNGIAGLSNGDFVVTWHVVTYTGQQVTGSHVFARRFSAGGAARGPAWRVNPATNRWSVYPVVAGLDQGRFVIAWNGSHIDTNASGVAYLLHDAQGRAIGAPRVANATTTGDQSMAAIDRLSSGGFVIAWNGAIQGGYGIHARAFSPSGAPLGAERLVSSGAVSTERSRIALAGLSNARYALAWEQDETAQSTAARDIFHRLYTNAGTAVTPPQRANITRVGDQRLPTIAALGGGGFVIGWADVDRPNERDILAQVFAATPTRQQTPFRTNLDRTGWRTHPDTRALGGGTLALATWMSWAQDGDKYGVMARTITQPSNRIRVSQK